MLVLIVSEMSGAESAAVVTPATVEAYDCYDVEVAPVLAIFACTADAEAVEVERLRLY